MNKTITKLDLVNHLHKNLGFNKNIGKLISCSHIGYPVIEGHHDSQYTEAEFQNYHVVKIGLPWIFSVPDGFSCLFTPPFNRQGSEDYFCYLVITLLYT